MWDALMTNPWWGVAALGVAGACVVAGAGRNERRSGLRRAGVGLIVAAAALAACGTWVVTPTERARAVVGEVVEVAEAYDATAWAAVVAPEARVVGERGAVLAEAARVRRLLERYRGMDHRLVTSDVRVNGSTASAFITVRTRGSAAAPGGGVPLLTDWDLRLRRGADGAWRVADLIWLRFNGSDPPVGLLR